MPSSPAVAARVEEEAQKLQRYFDRIQRCRVVVIAPHQHQRHRRRYSLHVELDVPGERLVVDHQPPSPRRVEVRQLSKAVERQPEDKDIYVVIRHVFDATRRQLEDYVRRLRGDVKRHETSAGLPK